MDADGSGAIDASELGAAFKVRGAGQGGGFVKGGGAGGCV
jgi:hypothetical protein